jgi:hypothetical protein
MHQKRNSLLSFSLYILAACAAVPPAKCIQYLDCADGMEDCKLLAQETCPGGYHVLRDNEVGQNFNGFAKQHFAGANADSPHMLVTCDN